MSIRRLDGALVAWRRIRLWRCTALLACGLAAGHPAAAVHAADAASATDAEAAPIHSAPVNVDGRTLLQLRGVTALSAEERADEVAERIRNVAADPTISASSVHIVDAGDRVDVVAGTVRLLSVLDADARAEGLANRTVLAETYRDAIARTLDRYRAERQSTFLVGQAIAAVIALFVLAAALFGLRWARKLAQAGVRRRLEAGGSTEASRTLSIFADSQMQGAVLRLVRGVAWLLALIVVFVALEYVLSLFPWTRGLARWGALLVLDPLRIMGRGIVAALPGLAFIAILALVVHYALHVLRLLFGALSQRRIRVDGFDADWAWPTYRLVRIATIAFAVIIAYPYIPGSSSDAFKGVSIFFGLLMSLGAASAVSNSLAGYMLIYRRTFRTGDRIRVGEVVGDVLEMRQQVTLVKTLKNEIVTIPSASMLTSEVTNYSVLASTSGLILHTDVGVGYDTPWRQARAMLLLAAARTEGVERDPPPFVLQKPFGDFAYVLQLNVYTRNAQKSEQVYTDLRNAVLDVFNEFGVVMVTPNYQDDSPEPKLVKAGQWYKAPATPPQESSP